MLAGTFNSRGLSTEQSRKAQWVGEDVRIFHTVFTNRPELSKQSSPPCRGNKRAILVSPSLSPLHAVATCCSSRRVGLIATRA